MANRDQKRLRGWQAWAETVFGMDVRSLAGFRVCLGLTVLLDVLLRFPDCEAFYSDRGLFDRAASYRFLEQFSAAGWEWSGWSWNWCSGAVWWQQLLFLVEALAAVCLVSGWGTRLATLVVWMMVVSQHVRNPLVVTSGDTLLKLMLFWSLFLPLDRVWSVAAWRRGATPETVQSWHASVASAGFILQVVWMYFFTGLAKFNEIWFAGEAMDYVLRLDLYITDFGRWILQYPRILKWVSWGTLLLELGGIWLLLVPWRNSFWRLVNMVLFWGFHLGIALCMSIGLFPLICLIAWLPMLPREAWTAAAIPRGEPVKFSEWQRGCLLAGLFLIAATLWVNLSNLSRGPFSRTLPGMVAAGVRALGLDQYFQMFGIPPRESPWFVYETRLKNGEQWDIFRPGHRLDLARPVDIAGTFPGHNWRKLHQNLVDVRLEGYRPALLEYAVRRWNESHGDLEQVQAAELRCFIERTGPDFNPVEQWSRVWGRYRDPQTGAGTLFDDLDRQLREGDLKVPF